jgi:hypothetical protein
MTDFQKILKYQISWKSIQWELGMWMDDGETGMTQLIVAFRNFVNVSKNCLNPDSSEFLDN